MQAASSFKHVERRAQSTSTKKGSLKEKHDEFDSADNKRWSTNIYIYIEREREGERDRDHCTFPGVLPKMFSKSK